MFLALLPFEPADLPVLRAFGMGLGTQEFLVLMVAVLVIFGPRRIPEVANFLGKAMRQFRKASMEIQDAINQEVIRQERDEQLKKAREAAARAREQAGETGEIGNTGTEVQDPYTHDVAPPKRSPDELPELEQATGTVPREAGGAGPAESAPSEEAEPEEAGGPKAESMAPEEPTAPESPDSPGDSEEERKQDQG